MVKHNNIIPNQHFRKDWQRHVKTWFNQPAKKEARRAARVAKAKKVAPRPLGLLHPVVRGQTNKYNGKVRAGRGFTLEELRGARINPLEARGLGISVDHRRKNRTAEGFQLNVNRLKLYRSKLVVFPRNPTSKRVKKGDAAKADRSTVKQVVVKGILPIAAPQQKLKARKIEAKERSTSAYSVARKARTDALLWGVREKRTKDKADAAAGKKPKDANEDGGD
jgi:large subunit ribosomal protein L13e